jgi:class 3 adenylate cyclase
VTLNENLDYFGQTVNVAARVQSLAGAGEICISEALNAVSGALA